MNEIIGVKIENLLGVLHILEKHPGKLQGGLYLHGCYLERLGAVWTKSESFIKILALIYLKALDTAKILEIILYEAGKSRRCFDGSEPKNIGDIEAHL